jgi:hypothetical protein
MLMSSLKGRNVMIVLAVLAISLAIASSSAIVMPYAYGVGSSSTMENMVLNLGTPLFIDHFRNTNIANITQNLSRVTFEGNGTFMLPTGNVSTISSGYSLINSTGGLVRVSGQVLVKTIDGKESATVDFARFTPINSTMGVGIAYIKTNSTGQLAPLNNTLMVYKNEAISQTQSMSTFWKWK